MRRELLIAAGPGEWRAALLENDEPVELRVERAGGAEIDSIYFGRVIALLPALGAALVEIGGERPAFLPQSEILPRGRRLDAGSAVIVQIRREAQDGKAPRLTTAVRLRGNFVELVAGRPGLAGAEALPAADQVRLAAITQAEVIGLRLQQTAPIATLIAEAERLRHRWDEIAARAAQTDPPARLVPAAGHAAALAAVFPPPDRIVTDQPAAVSEIRSAFPEAEISVVPEVEWPIDLDTIFGAALAPSLALAGGGTLHIEGARAATIIDVDSGTPETGSPQRTALATNLAAAAAIGRQIRLRGLGGGIAIDFVGLDDPRARDRVRAALVAAVAEDPLQPQVLGWTRLGHLELVRRRRTRPLADQLLERAFPAKTAMTLAHEVLRALIRAARAEPAQLWRVVAAPEITAALAGEAAAALRAAEARQGRPVALASDPALPRDRFQIMPL
jgi:ribonuclease G